MYLDTGTYTIQNVMHRNIAAQSSDSAAVVADADTDSGGLHPRKMLWTISRLNEDKYTIKNNDTNEYAASKTLPAIEDVIVTKQARQLWVIKGTGVKGRYVIYPTATHCDLFWGLSNGDLLTAVSLRNTPNNPGNQWVLTKVTPWRELQEENARLRDSVERLEETAAQASGYAQREIERHEQAGVQLQAKLARLEKENASLHDNFEQLNAVAKRESARHEQEDRMIQEKLRELEEENTQLRGRVEQLKVDAKRETGRHEQENRQFQRLEEENTMLRRSVERLNAETERYEQKARQLQAKLRGLEEENIKLRDRIERTIADANGERGRHEQEDRHLQAKLVRLEEEKTRLRDSVEQLKADARREKERFEAEIKTLKSVPRAEKKGCIIM